MLSVSLLLLAAYPVAPAQEPETPQPLPAVDSAEVAESQAAYKAWCKAAVARKVVPFHLSYEVNAHLNVGDGGGAASSTEVDFDAEGRVAFQSDRNLQFSALIQLDAEDEVVGSFNVDFLLDGKTMSIYVQSEMLPMIENGYRVEVDQAVAESAYHEYLRLAPALMDAMQEEGEAEAMATKLIFEAASDYLAPDFASYFHPTIYWNTANPYLVCRSFQSKDGVVDAKFTFDVGEDSVAVDLLTAFAEIEEPGMMETEEGAIIVEMIQSFAESSSIHMSFDAHSGIPLSADFDWAFSPADHGLDEDFFFHLKSSYRGHLESPQDPSLVLIRPQPEAEGFLDATVFVNMFMAEMQALTEEADAEEDMDF